MTRNTTSLDLYRKYVGDGPVNLDRLYAAILREKQAAESGEITVSRDLLRELRAELKAVARLRREPDVYARFAA